MPLNTAALQSSIKQAFLTQQGKKSNPDAAIDDLSLRIAEAVVDCVKNMNITFDLSGLNSGGQPVVGILNYTLN